jgi:hypothetical protein
MPLRPGEVRDVHAAIAPVDSLIRRRRATYSAVLELVAGPSDGDDVDLLDSPVARAHLGEVISGQVAYSPSAMVPLSQLLGRGHQVAASRRARTALSGACRRIAGELGRYGDHADSIRLVLADAPAFDEAAQRVVEGVRLAVEVCPELAEDLLPHVTLFAIVEQSGQRLGSASVREYAGLIVVPEPGSAIEVAEALIHEGAHQKLFDLATTCSILDPAAAGAPPFTPPWADPSAPPWPFEQVLAAFHAYTCLAAFMSAVEANGSVERLHEFSLLPHATTRAVALGDWLVHNTKYLGVDGLRFVALLTQADLADESPLTSSGITIRNCGESTLVAHKNERTKSIELMWLPAQMA